MNKEQLWAARKANVLERDGHRCHICSASGKLRIHHLMYDLFDKLFVPEKFLISLCCGCHQKITSAYAKPKTTTNPKMVTTRGKIRKRQVANTVLLVVNNLVRYSGAAKILEVSRPTVYAFIERGRLHPLEIADRYYLLREEIMRLKQELDAQIK